MKYLYLFFILLIYFSNCLETYAQQLPIFTQYRANRGYINPASIDLDALKADYNLIVGISHRNQWSGLKSGPTTQTLYGSYRDTDNRGLDFVTGAHIINDVAGRVGTMGIFPRFAFILSDDPDWRGISFGLTAGVVQHRLDLTGIDNITIPTNQQSQWNFDAGAGGFIYLSPGKNHNYLFAGFSMPQVLRISPFNRKNNGNFPLERVNHFYGQVGYYLDISDSHSFLEFSSWIKLIPNIPVHYDLSVRGQIGKVLWIGGGFSANLNPEVKSFNGMHVELGVNIEFNDSTIRIGYGFDDLLSEFVTQFGNTHEINITYLLDK